MQTDFNYKNVKPVRYNGRLFRSTLEARWAVFFDALGVRFQYEPGVYRTKSYQPDFLIEYCGRKYLVEVKPEGGITYSAIEKIENLYYQEMRLPIIVLVGSPGFKFYPCLGPASFCRQCRLTDGDEICFICGDRLTRKSLWHQVSFFKMGLGIGGRLSIWSSEIPGLTAFSDMDNFSEDYRRARIIANDYKF